MKTQFVKGLIMAIVAFLAAYWSENAEALNYGYVIITTVGIALTYIAKNAFSKSISLFGKIDVRDLLSGMLLAIGTAISSFAASIITTGVIDWHGLLIATATAVGGYFTKTFSSNSKGQILKKE